MTDPRYFASAVLSTLLGGGSSSRLFQEIREKRGLAYHVGAHTSGYADTGLFAVYAGTAPEAEAELLSVLIDEFKRLVIPTCLSWKSNARVRKFVRLCSWAEKAHPAGPKTPHSKCWCMAFRGP